MKQERPKFGEGKERGKEAPHGKVGSLHPPRTGGGSVMPCIQTLACRYKILKNEY